mgnify:CR=1 FL=1
MKKTLPVIITLGVILLLGTLTSWVAPNIVRNYGEEILGRKIRINDLKANIFTGAISMEGLTVFEEDGIMPFIHLHRAETNLSMLHLLTGIIDLETLRLSQLDINIQQRDTVFNFTDILQRFSEEEEEEAEGGYPLVIRDIELSKSSIHYQDLLVRSNIRINDVNLHIPGIDLRDLVTNMGLDLEFVDGGKLTTQMSYNDRTRHYTIDLLLNDFSLEGILPYVQQAMWSEKLTGQLNADLKRKNHTGKKGYNSHHRQRADAGRIEPPHQVVARGGTAEDRRKAQDRPQRHCACTTDTGKKFDQSPHFAATGFFPAVFWRFFSFLIAATSALRVSWTAVESGNSSSARFTFAAAALNLHCSIWIIARLL